MKLDSIITPELTLLESLQKGTDPLTRKNLQIMHENFVVPYSKWLKGQYTLLEAEMTPDQITQAFGYAEKIATAGGDNRTMLGKGADVAGAAAGAVSAGAKGAADLAVKGAKGAKDLAAKLVPQAVKDKFTKSLPAADAGPVEGFEQKATQAIAGIQDPKAKQSLMDKIKIGLQNPATQQLIMTGVSGIAGVIASTATAGIGGYAGAAAAGAITGSLLGAINAKMQGKDWKDAGKAALKGAAMGAAGGLIGKGVTDVASAGMNAYDSYQQQKATAGEVVQPVQPQMVDDNVAQQWAQAQSPAERAQIEQASGLSAQQIKTKLDMNAAYSNADLAAIRASGNSTNPDGTASPAMSRYMQAQADSMAADTKYQQAMGMDSTGAGAEAPINPDAAQQQIDLNKAVQDKIDTGAIPNPGARTVPGPDGKPISSLAASLNNQGAAPAPASQNTQDSDFSQAEINAPIKPSAGVQDIANQEAAKYGRVRPNLDDWRAANMLAKGRGVQTQSRINIGKPINENVDYELTARMWLLRNKVGKPYNKIHMTEEAILRAFAMAASEQLNEGPLDWIKKKAGQAADFVKTKAGNLTNKVTADKLQQAWTKAGSPTDSVEVAKIMAANGVPQDTVDQIMKNMGVPNAPAAPAQANAGAGAGAGAGAPEATPPQATAPEAPAKAGGRDIPVDPSSVAPPDAKQTPQGQDTTAGGSPTPEPDKMLANPKDPTTGQPIDPTTQKPPTNKEIAQGAISKAQASAKDATAGAEEPPPEDEEKPATDVAGTIQKGASEIQGITAAMKAGQGMGASGTSLMQPRSGSDTAGEVKIKDEKGQEHNYKKIGDKWYDKDNKEVPPAIAAMLTKQAQQQAALDKDKAGAEQKPTDATAETPDKMLANPKDPTTGQPIDPKAQGQQKPGAQQPQAGAQQPQAQGQQKPGAQQPTPATQQPQAQGQQKPGAQQPQAGAQQPATTGQSPEEIRKAKQSAAAKAAQDQMAANPAPGATPAATPAGTTTPPAKTHTGGKVAGQVSQTPNAIRKREQRAAAKQAATAGNDVMARMAKQLGAPTAGGPAQAEPAPAQQATPDYSKLGTGAFAGYGKTTYNVPTGVNLKQPAVQPTTGAKAVPVKEPAAEPAPAPAATPEKFGSRGIAGMDSAPTTAPAAPAAETPGFLQSKIKGRKQPEMAGIDFSAVLARKAQVRL